MTENYLYSKRKKHYWKDHFWGSFLFLIIGAISFANYTPENHAKNICLIFIIISSIAIFFILLNLLIIKDYSIKYNKLTESSILKNKVYDTNSIKDWTEKQYKGKFDNWEELTLYFKNSERVIISSDYFENYYDLKTEITKDKTRDIEKEEFIEKNKEKKLAIVFLIISFLFFYWAYSSLQVKHIKSEEIIVVSDKTSKRIKYNNGKSRYVEIELTMYPDLIFVISGNDAMQATDVKNLIEEVNVGDSIFVGINKIDYRTKLTKVDSLTFSDKYFFNERISVESAKSVNSDYLKLSDNNFRKSENIFWNCFLFFLFGLIFFSMSIVGLTKKSE